MKAQDMMKAMLPHMMETAEADAKDWMDAAIYKLTRQLESVQRYRDAMEQMSLYDQADRVNWVVNDLQQLNFRFDDATRVVAKLKVADEMTRLMEDRPAGG